ncbi:hypothetical protein PVK06_016926 [Gossypium arboreum]|uniref:RNase H type-1 domain-containing protein n=1 Tax=Gossypium arboreum TaxID=29729 RepID=A0ABR0Q1U3_GOSAR|nr:hypothetical protein PVK06_016926 [Gossypium arboreum]
MMIGMSDIFQVESWAMLEGLKLAWAQGFRQVELESDNALLIDVIQNGLVAGNNCSEIRLIHDWCSKDWDVKFRYILRDNNKVVDCIAKEARGGM